MKLSIIRSDGAVYKDELSYSNLDLNQIPSDVHALQWENNVGHIEFVNCYKVNEEITELPIWANDALNSWQIAYDAEQKAIADAKAKIQSV